MDIATYKIPLYGGQVVVVLTTSKDDIQSSSLGDVIEFEPREFFMHSVNAVYDNLDSYICIINISRVAEITLGYVAHEALHLSHMLASNRGLNPDFEYDEALAYILTFIADTIDHSVQPYLLNGKYGVSCLL